MKCPDPAYWQWWYHIAGEISAIVRKYPEPYCVAGHNDGQKPKTLRNIRVYHVLGAIHKLRHTHTHPDGWMGVRQANGVSDLLVEDKSSGGGITAAPSTYIVKGGGM